MGYNAEICFVERNISSKKYTRNLTASFENKNKQFYSILCCSDGSGTRKPENLTRPEGFLLTRTRPEPEKNITNPTRPEPEILQTRPENPKKPEYIKNMHFYQNIHKVFTEKVRPKFVSLIFFYFSRLFLKISSNF